MSNTHTHITRQRLQHRRGTPHPRAFSLIELLVVVSIIAVIAATSIGGILSLMRANAVGNAVNVITAQASTARSIALRDGKDTLLVIRHANGPDTSTSSYDTNARVTLSIAQISGTGAVSRHPVVTNFQTIQDRAAVTLPAGVRVITKPTSISTQWIAPSQRDEDIYQDIVVWFAPNGSVTYVDPQSVSGSSVALVDAPTPDLQLDAIAPYLFVFDDRTMQAEVGPFNPKDSGFNNEITTFTSRAFPFASPASDDYIDADIAIVSFSPNTGLPTVQRNTETP